MRAPGMDTAPAALNSWSRNTLPLTLIPSPTRALPLTSVPVSWAERQVSEPVISGSGSRTAPAAVNPLVEEHAAANPHPVADQGVAVAVGAGELGAAADQLAGDVGVRQPDGAGSGEPLVEEHVAADLHPVADQGVAVAVGAGELGATTGQLAGDIGARQPDYTLECDPPRSSSLVHHKQVGGEAAHDSAAGQNHPGDGGIGQGNRVGTVEVAVLQQQRATDRRRLKIEPAH